MGVIATMRRLLRPLRQKLEPSFIRRRRIDKEYASGKWRHVEQTPGAWVYQFVEKHCRGGSILDVGCGSGNTGNELDTKSYSEYTGVDLSGVAIQTAIERSEKNGRAAKNRYVASDMASYVPAGAYDVILFRESIHFIRLGVLRAALDRYARYLLKDGVFVVAISRDSTRDVREIVALIEANYHVVEKHWRKEPAPDAARYHGDAYVIVFRQGAN